ncbi:Uncharacterized protein C5D6.12 [Choanephora cucurbitarum]|uniref:Uncharacterized protein C5D6.12 n=1 Tax=Choanephora cucurbitarum TaxID=101091 RepID=A0A1C7NMP3_9FUNG|nr:Uncharacterized protein C5D6.12 [Choanephora cucurbitarum]
MKKHETEETKTRTNKRAAVKRTTPSYTSVLAKRYTTENKDTPHFWELDVQEKTFEAPASSKRSDTRDFKNLLDSLFTTTKDTSTTEPLIEPLNQSSSLSVEKTETLIQKKLLEMVLKKSKPIKARAPVPRPLAAPLFGRRNQVTSDRKLIDIIDAEDMIDYSLSEDERIQAKQKEVQTIQNILDTAAPSDLLTLIQKEIDHPSEKYPAYYPRVLAAAIEHVAAKDPYVALTIFEMAKTKSISSYLVGCTVDVYNAMLMIRWDVWRDIYGMLKLVEEMTLNGIAYDRRSRQIIKQVVQEIENEGDLDFEAGVFWNADEKRSCHIMKELVGKWLI